MRSACLRQYSGSVLGTGFTPAMRATVTAVVVPVALMLIRGDSFEFTPRGITFATLGGIADTVAGDDHADKAHCEANGHREISKSGFPCCRSSMVLRRILSVLGEGWFWARIKVSLRRNINGSLIGLGIA